MPTLDPRPVMGIDIDGCVADVYGHLRTLALDTKGWECPVPRWWDYNDQPPELRAWVQAQFGSPEFYAAMPVIQSARTALYALSTQFDLVFVTARAWQGDESRADLRQVTMGWLERTDLPPHQVVFCRSEEKAGTLRACYANVAFAVDDNPTTVESYWRQGIRSYLVDYPFNRTLPDEPGLTRVRTLQDVVVAERLAIAPHWTVEYDEELYLRKLLKDAGII